MARNPKTNPDERLAAASLAVPVEPLRAGTLPRWLARVSAVRSILSWTVYAAVLGFLLLMGSAMAAYPGGHLWDKSAPGYDFWRNFWCDLLRNQAYNGTHNLVAPGLAQAAMCCLAAGILVCFCLAPRLFQRERWLGVCVSVLGACGALGLALITWLSGGAMPQLHGLAVLLAGPLGLGALIGTLVGLARAPGVARGYVLLGGATLLVSLTSLIQYVREFVFQAMSSPFLPFSQKLATLLALSWMLLVSARASRVGGRGVIHAKGPPSL